MICYVSIASQRKDTAHALALRGKKRWLQIASYIFSNIVFESFQLPIGLEESQKSLAASTKVRRALVQQFWQNPLMDEKTALSHSLTAITNPLVTVGQLETSASQIDGVPSDLEKALFYHGALLTQAAGILLKLPQDIIAPAVVTFQRFFVGEDGGSFKTYSVKAL